MPAKKSAPAKSAAASKKSAARPVKATAKVAAKSPVKKPAAPRKAKQVDYRLLDIQKRLGVVEDVAERARLEQVCLGLVQRAHELVHARTEDGIDYRKHLAEVSHIAKELAWASITEDEDEIMDASAGMTDELDGSPLMALVLAEQDVGGLESMRLVQAVLRAEEIDLAFFIRGRD